MALPSITPAYFSHNCDDITPQTDNTNFTGSVTSPNGGPSLAAVTSAPSGHCVYRTAGIDGWPALQFNATGGLFGSNATVSSYTNNGSGAVPNKTWTVGMRISCSTVSSTNHPFCFSSSSDADPFVTIGPQFTNPTSSWQARRRDDVTSAGGGLGVLVSGATTGVHTLVAVFDGTNISLYVDGTIVGTATSATSSGAFTPNQVCWGALFRQLAGTPIGSPFNGLIRRTIVADGAVNSTDRATIETWLAAAPDAITIVGAGSFAFGGAALLNVEIPIVGAGSFAFGSTGQISVGGGIVGAASFGFGAAGQLAPVETIVGAGGFAFGAAGQAEAQESLIGIESDALAGVGSSTQKGYSGGASPFNPNYLKYVASDLSTSVAEFADNGYTTWQILPTGTVNPAPFEQPDPARNITAALATNPTTVVFDIQSDVGKVGGAYFPTYPDDWVAYIELVVANIYAIKAECDAVDVLLVISCCDQPHVEASTAPYVERRVAMRARLREEFPDNYWDKWPLIAQTDRTARDELLFDAAHPDQPTHRLLADLLRPMLITAPTSLGTDYGFDDDYSELVTTAAAGFGFGASGQLNIGAGIVGAASFGFGADGQLNLGLPVVGAASFAFGASGQLIGGSGVVGAASFGFGADGQLNLGLPVTGAAGFAFGAAGQLTLGVTSTVVGAASFGFGGAGVIAIHAIPKKTRVEQFAAEMFEVLHASASGRTADVQCGAEAESKNRHVNRRRVIVIGRGGEVSSSKQTGGRPSETAVNKLVTLAGLREEDVVISIAAETRYVAEHLLDNVIAAIVKILPTAKFRGYVWRTQEDNKAGSTIRAELVDLRLVLPLPVPDEPSPLTDTDYMHTAGDSLNYVIDSDTDYAERP